MLPLCVLLWRMHLTHDIAVVFKDDRFIWLEGDGLGTLLLQLLDCTTQKEQVISSPEKLVSICERRVARARTFFAVLGSK